MSLHLAIDIGKFNSVLSWRPADPAELIGTASVFWPNDGGRRKNHPGAAE